jgi:aspartyl protease family protein
MMDGDELSRVIYLMLLLVAVVGWFISQNRVSLGKMAQQALAWGLIFLGGIAGIGLWEDVRGSLSPRQTVFEDQGRIELPRAQDGHYYVTLQINGTPVEFVVDTGATSVVLTQQDAIRAGLNSDNLVFLSEARTANGAVQPAPVTLNSVALGPIHDSRVPAYVNGGEMDTSLLGMS